MLTRHPSGDVEHTVGYTVCSLGRGPSHETGCKLYIKKTRGLTTGGQVRRVRQEIGVITCVKCCI